MMSWQTELRSWMSPPSLAISEVPGAGQVAPTNPKLAMPPTDGRPVVLTFLRHCGCPCMCTDGLGFYAKVTAVAGKTFLGMLTIASKREDAHFIAVSHSDREATDRWLASLPELSQSEQSLIEVIVDTERQCYAAWGLGVSSFCHVLSPSGLYAVYKLGKKEGIWNRPTESGNRWQTSGSFAVDSEGSVKWSRPSASANDIPDFEEALKAL